MIFVQYDYTTMEPRFQPKSHYIYIKITNTKHQLKTIQKIEHNLACMGYVKIFCL